MLILLFSDILWWILIVGLLFGLWRLCHNPQLKSQWMKVFNQPLAMVCFCLLSFYGLLTCLDSIHFYNQDGGIESVLDKALAPISEQTEQSYSEPFAVYALNKTNVAEGGVVSRQYPRLRYAAADLSLPEFAESRQLPSLVVSDIYQRLMQGVLLGLALALILLLPLWWVSRRMRTWATRRCCFITTGCLLIVISAAYWMSLDYHIFGTDKLGNDVFVNVLKGTRTAILIGTLTTFVLLPLAIVTGLSAGYFRGLVDDCIQYIYTTLNSIPGILLIASAVLLLQVFMDQNNDYFEFNEQRADARLVLLCAILGITSWTGLCRLLRAETLKLRSLEYVQSAQAFGLSNRQILVRHIFPNLSHIVLIVVVLDFSALVLAEAVLAYVGVGVDPTTPSWGNMINSARMEIAKYPPIWWSIGAVFLLMFVLVLATNLFADAVKKEFDPHSRSIT